MNEITIASALLLGGFGLLLILRVPIAFSLLLSSLLTALYLGIPLSAIVQRTVQGVRVFSLLAIPLFILTGELMKEGGISKRLINLSNLIVGRVRGGLAQVNVLGSMFFGGISGSAVADVSSIGSIMIPMMKRKGYDADYSVAVTVTSATQGVIIPPSHNVIIYSLAAGGVSVGRLFLGGIIPGVLLGLSLMAISWLIALRRGYPREERYSRHDALRIVREALLGLLTPIIIIGGVISGVFTATESAAIACVYAFIITFFIYREQPLRAIGSILVSSLKVLAVVMSVIAAASAFGWLLAFLQIPAKLTAWLLGIGASPILLLLLINLLLLLLGAIMDMAPLIVIMTPILYPVVVDSLGVHPVHFGIIMMLNLGIGLSTPPVGSALFIGSAIGRISIETATRAMVPFYLTMVIMLLLVNFVPQLTLFIPNAFF